MQAKDLKVGDIFTSNDVQYFIVLERKTGETLFEECWHQKLLYHQIPVLGILGIETLVYRIYFNSTVTVRKKISLGRVYVTKKR